MAVNHGIPGEWARVRGTILSMWPLFLAFTFFGIFLAALIWKIHVMENLCLFVLSVVAVLLLWRKGAHRVKSFFIGARGEERVAGALLTLGDEWHVFNDFVANGIHVDHVAVGPSGVFAVETKNWRGAVTVEEGHILVDGSLPTRDPLAQTLHQADAVKAALSKAGWTGGVTPVLCFASDTFDMLGTGLVTVGGVTVINASLLSGTLEDMPQAIAPQQLERLSQLMETMGV